MNSDTSHTTIEYICLRQVGKSTLEIDLSNVTHGDCRKCIPDYKNKNCSGYYPVKLYGDYNGKRKD